MSFRSRIRKAKSDLEASRYRLLDKLFTKLDRKFIRRTNNIDLIPLEAARKGGKYSYGEWAHVIGIFQTLIALNLNKHTGNRILDIGCGTGLLGIAAKPFVESAGTYIGVDIQRGDIEFCRNHYPAETYEFHHIETQNPVYAPDQNTELTAFPVAQTSVDLVTALSVWTHFCEEHALFHFKEIDRVLKPGGRAIVTFFLLDEFYDENSKQPAARNSKFHQIRQSQLKFQRPAYGSDAWYYTNTVEIPEDMIGITPKGLDRLLEETSMTLVETYPGNWKNRPGVYYQDVLIFEKS